MAPALGRPDPARFAGLLLLACLLSCGAEPAPKRAALHSGRVLLVGVDGATLRIVDPLLARGRLPHLASLKRQGYGGRLRSHRPIESPRIWASIATGKRPEKHGIRGFVRATGDGRRRLYASGDRRAHALWNIASDVGLKVAVVNWWNTHPPEKVRGVMVSDHLLPLQVLGVRVLTGLAAPERAAIVHPQTWSRRVLALRDEDRALTDFEDPFRAPRLFGTEGAKRLSRHFRDDEAVVRIALEIDAQLRPDLAMVFLPGIDRVSHVLWGSAFPPTLPDVGPLRNALRAKRAAALHLYYEYTDALIGRLLDAYGPDDLVLVVSDHGFESSPGEGPISGRHESQAALDGIVFARGPGIVRAPDAGEPASVNDIAPTILAWQGLPIGEDMDGRPAAFLETETLSWVASWDGAPIERVGSGPSGAEGAILEQLDALGYLEAPTHPAR